MHLFALPAAHQPPPCLRSAPDSCSIAAAARLKTGPVTFRLRAQLAQPGDPTNDATKAWPADRKVAELGTLTINRVVADSDAVQKQLLFLPGNLTDGIEPSDDPLIDVRDAAYPVSFARRNQ